MEKLILAEGFIIQNSVISLVVTHSETETWIEQQDKFL